MNYQKIINHMLELVKKNKKVVFVGNFEFPQAEVEVGRLEKNREKLTALYEQGIEDVNQCVNELLAYLSVRATQLGMKACEVPVTRAYPKKG